MHFLYICKVVIESKITFEVGHTLKLARKLQDAQAEKLKSWQDNNIIGKDDRVTLDFDFDADPDTCDFRQTPPTSEQIFVGKQDFKRRRKVKRGLAMKKCQKRGQKTAFRG